MYTLRKKSINKLLYLVLSILFLFDFVYGSNELIPQNQLKFKYLTIEDGLVSNHIRSICQDTLGYIWFATDNGICKYNGYTVKKYSHNPSDSSTISSNDVSIIFCDSKGTIWVANTKGLYKYVPELDNFNQFTHSNLSEPLIDVRDIVEDLNQNLWIGTLNGLYFLNPNSNEFF